MFKVMIHDGKTAPLEDDVYYVVGKEGIFLKKSAGLLESLAPVKNIPTLETVTCFANIYIEKIPVDIFKSVYNFFKEVYKRHASEAAVLLFYNKEKGNYKIIVPSQEVSAASCDYKKGMSVKGMLLIGTIHSHAAFSAFHSSTDDNDEKSFDGIHITIGHVNSDKPTISTSVVSNGFRDMKNSLEFIEGIKSEGKKGKADCFSIQDDSDYFNLKWMYMVTKKEYKYAYNYGNYTYDALSVLTKYKNQKSTYINTPKDGVLYPKAKQSDLFENHKIDYLEDTYTTYRCVDCYFSFKTEEEDFGGLICPSCASDNLIEVVDSDWTYTKDEKESTKIPFTKSTGANTITDRTTKEEDKEHFITCKECGNSFSLDENKPFCPFCYYDVEEDQFLRKGNDVEYETLRGNWFG